MALIDDILASIGLGGDQQAGNAAMRERLIQAARDRMGPAPTSTMPQPMDMAAPPPQPILVPPMAPRAPAAAPTGAPIGDVFAGDWSVGRQVQPAPQPTVPPFQTTVTPEPMAAPATLPAPSAPPAAPDADAIMTGAVNAAASRPPQREVNFWDRLGALASGYRTGGLAGGVAAAANGVDRAIAGENATARALVAKGASPDMAQAMISNPQMMQLAPLIFSPKTAVVNNRLVNTQTGQVLADLSDAFVAAPEGASTLYNKSTGATLPIAGGVDRQERARQTAVGKAQGEAQAALPTAVQKATDALKMIDQLRTHPGRAFATGATGIIPGIPGTEQRNFISLLDQAKGTAFLQAYEALRGGGAISEVEGKMATQAIARLERTQSEPGFLDALNDLEKIIRRGLATAQAKAAGTRPQAPRVPTVGAVEDGYRFKGGDPGDPNSWERVQ